ncbi:hypothetical protein [Streptomyces sp. Z26]|uniref:hypothetical protein n=1 Tax=Streptomyces sp. Z26 TaxID=2500177 RepID=UPI000EF16E84|nr:hypothetical protein [Streptomyces sp. Z26]RLL67775.1 hypothetical protein D7M15_14025 [Streptomyces sp. Z26]
MADARRNLGSTRSEHNTRSDPGTRDHGRDRPRVRTRAARAARASLGVTVLACAAVLLPAPLAAAGNEPPRHGPDSAPATPPWAGAGWGAVGAGPDADDPSAARPGTPADPRGETAAERRAERPEGARDGARTGSAEPSPRPGDALDGRVDGAHPGAYGRTPRERPADEPAPEPVEPAAERLSVRSPVEPETEPQVGSEPWSPAPVVSPGGDARARTDAARGVEAAFEGTGATAAGRGEPILPVLPLGAGLTSLGLGLGFLALRLRRA